VWIWHLIGSARLPTSLRDAILETPDRLWLSSISIWELGHLVARGRIELSKPLREWVADGRSALPIEEAPVTAEIVLRSHELALPHRDPADHLLAATVLVYGLTLLTVDQRLTDVEWLPTLPLGA
jgi:PIN domain nuclease of toxin-antitoxin system